MTTHANPQDHPLWADQVRLEGQMADRGVSRFRHALQRNREQGRFSVMGGAKTALSTIIVPMADAIRKFQKEASGSEAGRRHSIIGLVQNVEPEILAFLTARAIIDVQHKRQSGLTTYAQRLGIAVQVEERICQFEKENPSLCRVIVSDLNTRTAHEDHRVKVMSHVIRVHSATVFDLWSKKEKIHVGIKLLELIAESTGIITIERIFKGKRSTLVVTFSPSFWTWIQQLDDVNAFKLPTYMPCVIPPRQRSSILEDSYHTDQFPFPHGLVRRCTKKHLKLLETADLTYVYDAINAVQNTAWKIERRTLEVAENIIDSGIDIGVLPPMRKEEIPTKPADIKTNKEARTAWKKVARETHDRNERKGSKRLTALRQVAIAREMVDYPNLYFPHNLDFRGRMYPIPVVLNPQESDLARSMLVFAEGLPIVDDRAEGWLAVHGANMWGEDKQTLDDRISWVYENSGKICEAAADPLANLWWTEADEPWCFLTWAFEWAGFITEGRGFVSHIPVALDGTCNGIQHYSAMLRDPIGAAATNLLPSDRPQDIYTEVAKVVVGKLEAICGDYAVANPTAEQIMANKWRHFGITRKITKRPVMVLPYGGTTKSCRDYVREAVYEEINEGGKRNLFGEELFRATSWLSVVVWDSIGEVVVAARAAMSWLKEVTRVAGSAIQWGVPSGFVVHQDYKKLAHTRVDTKLYGSTIKLVLATATDDTDRRRQLNGVAPNFVHSLDASALVGTVGYAVDSGVSSFAMIHDSYGTHAASTDILAACTRHAFVDMYEDHNVLAEFRDSIAALLSLEELPAVPVAGDFDLKEVLDSQFFFA